LTSSIQEADYGQLRQPADGCQGISISLSDFLTLLPGQQG